jgi:hypothetical protein
MSSMPRRASPCYNCGTIARTRDHVFPRSLFTTPRPSPSPTVPACRACQQRTAPDEVYFRNFIAGGAYQHPTARALWDGQIVRSFGYDPSARKTLADALRRFDVRSKRGIFLGSIVGVEGDRDGIGNVLRKIVRGLFYLESRNVMPHDVSWHFEQVSPLNAEPVPDVTGDLIRTMPLRTVGTEVKYKFALAPEDPRLTLAWLAFYDRTMLIAGTLPEGPTPYDQNDAETTGPAHPPQ